MKTHKNIDEFLTRSGVALKNAAAPEIQTALAVYGYDAARLRAGQDLYDRAAALHAAQKKEYGEQFAATEALDKAHDAADAVYTVHRKLAALALRDSEHRKALGLGKTPRSFSAWLGQAVIFYTNLTNDADAVQALARYNITPAHIEQGRALVQQVADLNAAQEKEKSEAQTATKARDAALDDLDEWMLEFRQVAEIALAANPQALEAMQFGPVA